MKFLLWFVLGSIGLVVALIAALAFYLSLSLFDEYTIIKKFESPDGTRVGMIIGNHGGGGAGYCRDLIYDFPNSSNSIKISNESSNKKFLVKETNCDVIKTLSWKKTKLVLN